MMLPVSMGQRHAPRNAKRMTQMIARLWIALGSLSAALALAVAARFFHATEGDLALPQRLVFDIANDIHLAHSLALVGVGIITGIWGSKTLVQLAGIAFVLGMLAFCGGIYATFGPEGDAVRRVIPVGGVLLMAGWVILAASVFTLRKPA